MLDWEQIFATRSSRMKASEIRELLKLLEQPDIISFAGGIPTRLFSPQRSSSRLMRKFFRVRRSTRRCNIR